MLQADETWRDCTGEGVSATDYLPLEGIWRDNRRCKQLSEDR